jgi:hypothetical protein
MLFQGGEPMALKEMAITELRTENQLPDSMNALLPAGVTSRQLDCDSVPTVSIVIAWKQGNDSRLVREFVRLVRRCCEALKDVTGLAPPAKKS